MSGLGENTFWVYLIGSSVISAFVAGLFALWAARTNSEPNKQKVINDTQGSIIGDLQEERNHFKQKSESAERVVDTQKLYIEKLKHHMGALELRLMVNGMEVPPRPQLD